MKKLIGVALLAASVVVVGCEEKKAEPAKAAEGAAGAMDNAAKGMKDAAGKAVEGTKDAAGKAVEGAKDAAGKVAEGAKDATNKAADAGKQATDDAAAKAKTGMLAELKTKVEGIQTQIDSAKKQVAALPEIARKPAQDALASIEKKYTDLKASFGGLEKVSGDEFTKLSGQVGAQASSLSEELGKLIKK